MRLLSVDLENFRNFGTLHLEFQDGILIFTGDNAQGKTNLLEAIYFASAGRSFRTSQDKDLLRFSEEEGHLKLFFERQGVKHRIDMHVKKNRSKGLALDGVPVRRTGDFIGVLSVILFSPEDLQIVKEGPSERRRFLDTEISLSDKVYYYALTKYRKALEQRNQLLKDLPFFPTLRETLEAWDETLVKAGTELIRARRVFLEELKEIARETHRSLTGGKEELLIRYEPSVTEEDFRSALKANLEKDLKQKTTSVGPHRDDIGFDLIPAEDGKETVDARVFGSQGQQRTAALSLKLSEIEYLKRKTGEAPVLLLDDVLSELDSGRQEALLDHLSGVQTFITCTGLEEFVRSRIHTDQVYYVANGVITNGK